MDEPSRVDMKLLGKLVRRMTRAELSELEIDDTKQGLRLHLKRGGADEHGTAPLVHVHQGAGTSMAAPAAAGAAGERGADEPTLAPASGRPFLSPMVGTFYRSPSPDADPFVDVGSRVEEDSVLCIIEAMKVMNEIRAETKGEIAEVLVENGEPVEYGQPLFLLR
jgi:acetyl-CoA carboxylase biotin carboxyl carrier protein